MSEKKTLKDLLKGVEIDPLKDHEIHHNQHHVIIEKGVKVTIPEKFLQNLVTEKVINKIPTKKKEE